VSRFRFRLTVLAATAALTTPVLVACGTTDGSERETAHPTELRLAIGGESEDGYDPTLGWGRYGSPLFQSTLLTRDADLEIVGDLATSYEVSEDGLTWTVELRDDAFFTDGEPVTATDVAYTFTTAAEAGGLVDLTTLEDAVAVDATTVEFHLTEPRSTFVNRLVSLGIVPAHAHGDDYAGAPVGSGPFRFVSWQRGQQLVVERNDDYYGDLPDFERLVFVFTDEDATLAAARAGEVHLAGVPSSLAGHDIDGMTLHAAPSVDNRGIAFPMLPADGEIGNDVTADLAIRQAVNLAVDREQLVEGILEGYGAPASGPVDGLPWHAEDSVPVETDLDAARTALDEAGWVDRGGIREKDGVTASFSLLYPASDSLRQGLALAVADMVAPVGVEIVAEGVSWEEIEQRMHSEAVLFGWGNHDPIEMYNLHHSSLAGEGWWNPGHYADETVDAHLDAALSATTEEEALEHWRAAQVDADGGGFLADVPWAWLVNLEHTYFAHDCIDLGPLQVEPHGHGWPITNGITRWQWTC
jgi:peptide/nickel transport system substrate-binding protein